MRPNFTQCGDDFLAHAHDIYSDYLYQGRVQGILADHGIRPDLITLKGCESLCGTGREYYVWRHSRDTITTWVLPAIGLLIQAPWETNKFIPTVRALGRWVGSPIATLSYTLWNVKVIGKCALMLDMAVGYDEKPDQDSSFGEMRDSLYTLSVMNQYSVFEDWEPLNAERLLRVALFSNALRLSFDEDAQHTLPARRRELAEKLRIDRKKGVVPVFLTIFWFLFALAISIQAAFGEIGTNQAAHDLALGLLLSWLPVLIVVTAVDRNPSGTDQTKKWLNKFLDEIRYALPDAGLRDAYLRTIHRNQNELSWTANIRDQDFDLSKGQFFSHFAGQGRVRWHYGVAHPILAGIEKTFVAGHGRGWLEHSMARSYLEWGDKVGSPSGLRTFDFREIWQILSSLIIVGGTVTGAFILSYFTPTVGLGCRSGGYMILFVIALTNFTLEMLLWPSYFSKRSNSWLWMWAQRFLAHPSRPSVTATGNRILRHMNSNGWWAALLKDRLHKALSRWNHMNTRDRFGLLVLTPMDAINGVWLAYIVLAQTFGAYRSCSCMSSNWGWHQGYIAFESYDFYRSNGVYSYWVPGTVLSCFIMMTALAFLTVEWCTISHLNTSSYDAAMAGLHRTRVFKRYTIWVRRVPNWVIDRVVTGWHAVFMHTRRKVGRRSLVWSGPINRKDCETGSNCTRMRRQREDAGHQWEAEVEGEMEMIDGQRPLRRDPSHQTYALSDRQMMVGQQKEGKDIMEEGAQ